jgi:hypothetical protein
VTGGGDNSAENPPPVPRPGTPPVWGELKCQQNLSCQDVALNHKYESVQSFFVAIMLNRYIDDPSADRAFRCARKLGKVWSVHVGGDPYDAGLDQFLVAMVDLDSCHVRGSIEKKLKQYFVMTEDYKNETTIR